MAPFFAPQLKIGRSPSREAASDPGCVSSGVADAWPHGESILEETGFLIGDAKNHLYG
jgi:hypothetical protein